MFKGAYTAIVTPFDNGKIDYNAFEKILYFQLVSKISGIVLLGTTGESPTFSDEEKVELIKFTKKIINAQIPLIVGTGTNSTKKSIENTKIAEDLGADGILAVAPYYNKPTQNGLYEHYKSIAESVKIPIILYNVPGRTASNINPTTVAKLSEISNITAIKEASGNLDSVSEIRTLCDITILSGDDSLTLPMMSLGGQGVISVASNIVPDKVSKMTEEVLSGNFETAQKIHLEMFDLFKGMFYETNPLPVKTALAKMNMCKEEFRLPLTKMTPEIKEKLFKLLEKYF